MSETTAYTDFPGEDLFREYLDDAAATGRALIQRDGATWFHTGDLVARDAGSGALRFVGRRDDVIKVSGETVSLTEVCRVPRPRSSAVRRGPRGLVGTQPGGRRAPARLVPDRRAAPHQRGQGPQVQALTRTGPRASGLVGGR